MKKIFIPCAQPTEKRAPMLPPQVAALAELGAEVSVEKGLGACLHCDDAAYTEAGARILDRAQGFAESDILLMLNKPTAEDIGMMREGTVLLSFLEPLTDFDTVGKLASAGVSAFSMELVPRTTIAQKMDALSSQASLAGYAATIYAVQHLDRIIPMMMTPAGTLSPARFFIIGAGVAGLQAIATARRLGARVQAFDTRPAVEEEVKSLGAQFLKIDLGETGQSAGGYAKELTQEQLARQQEAMEQACAQADVVITTAQVFGRRAPRIVTKAMIAKMKPGSLILDMASETGGNVEGSVTDQKVVVNGVSIYAPGNIPGLVAQHASQMYGSNLVNFVEHFWDREQPSLRLDQSDEIATGALVTHGGEIVNDLVKERMSK